MQRGHDEGFAGDAEKPAIENSGDSGRKNIQRGARDHLIDCEIDHQRTEHRIDRDRRRDSAGEADCDAAGEVHAREREERAREHCTLDADIDDAAFLDQQFAQRSEQDRRRHRDG